MQFVLGLYCHTPILYLHTSRLLSYIHYQLAFRSLEGLCRHAYIHLQRVAKERDHHYDHITEILLERDYYKSLHDSQNSELSVHHVNGLPVSSPIRSPSVNPEMIELKKKCRALQEKLWVVLTSVKQKLLCSVYVDRYMHIIMPVISIMCVTSAHILPSTCTMYGMNNVLHVCTVEPHYPEVHATPTRRICTYMCTCILCSPSRCGISYLLPWHVTAAL